MTTILAAVAGLITVAGAAALAYKLGLGKKVGDDIQAAPDMLTAVKPGASEGVRGAAVLAHYVELAAKRELTGDALQAFLAFVATGPTPAAAAAYAEQHFGAGFVRDIEASLPDVARDELAVFGDHLPSVVRDFVAKLLPDIAHQQAQQQLSADEVAKKIAALSGAKAA